MPPVMGCSTSLCL